LGFLFFSQIDNALGSKICSEKAYKSKGEGCFLILFGGKKGKEEFVPELRNKGEQAYLGPINQTFLGVVLGLAKVLDADSFEGTIFR
jgi:hypothetical protein